MTRRYRIKQHVHVDYYAYEPQYWFGFKYFGYWKSLVDSYPCGGMKYSTPELAQEQIEKDINYQLNRKKDHGKIVKEIP